MNFSDTLTLLQWWIFLFLIGISFLPITSRLFSGFLDRGYAFSKILGVVFISYFVFLLGIFHVAPFARLTIIGVILFLLTVQLYRYRLSLLSVITKQKAYFFLEEIFFLAGLFLWTYIRGFAPEIHGLEKYMDFGFINSILRSEYFPPKDMWLTPQSINYYYFGHLVTAVLTKLSGIPSSVSYNFMLGTLVGMTLSASFSIGLTLLRNTGDFAKRAYIKIVAAGILTALLVTFSGNLHTIYTLYRPYENEKPVPFWELEFTGVNPCYGKDTYTRITKGQKESVPCSPEDKQKFSLFPNSYWYPNATRYIHNTIHEFPIYSWVVADLHGHVFDIPFVLLTIGFGLSLLLQNLKPKETEHHSPQRKTFAFHRVLTSLQNIVAINPLSLVFAGFLLGIMYMTNAWDGIIYFLFFALLLLVVFWSREKKSVLSFLKQTFPSYFLSVAVIFFTFIAISLPFSFFFKPFASGIGILCAPDFLVRLKEVGPFLFEADHCQRSPWWQLLILYGFFYFFVLSFVVFLFKIKKVLLSDIFALVLIILGTMLILIPEFIYLKDIYPDHYRANTMFKLVFQSFILLSIATGYIIVRILSYYKFQISNFKFQIIFTVWIIVTLFFLSIVFIYPFQATNSYYGNLMTYKGIDGVKYLRDTYPSDYEAIQWINSHIKGQPVILEAQGDSYTDYARVSSNTGLPTILGWTVHEWLWRGSYDVPAPRIAEVQTLYETQDLSKAKELLKKYNVAYVFVGSLEKEKYPNLFEKKFSELGDIVFQKDTTKIYQIK
jgi:YYY domain-containing protein